MVTAKDQWCSDEHGTACSAVSQSCSHLVLQIEELQTQKGAQTAVEARATALDEKYNKLKSVYTKLREEHIELLRANGETKKQVVLLTESEREAQEKMEVSSNACVHVDFRMFYLRMLGWTIERSDTTWNCSVVCM